MIIQCKALLIIVIAFCVVSEQANGAESGNALTQDSEIRYSYPNDPKSSISITFIKIRPSQPDEDWAIDACVTKNAFYYCDYSTTYTSTRDKITDALSRAIHVFQRTKPDAYISHINCSPFITSETLTTFHNWIEPAKSGKDNVSRSKCLENRLRTYTFDPLRSDLNSMLSKYGYRVASIGYKVEPGISLFVDADAYIEYLETEHSAYYIELERLE